jgi:nitrogen fixation protein NifU and related proteins
MSTGNWAYTEEVKDHFMNPRNILGDENIEGFDGKGIEGNIKCGDEMMVVIKVDKQKKVITDCKWKTYGCASAIASMSVLSEMIKGMSLEEAYKIKPEDINQKLSGLPQNKIHCSVLGDKALRLAIDDYYKRVGQANPYANQVANVVCKCMNITDEDIKKAIDDGAATYEELQAKTKCGTVCGECKDDIVGLLNQYKKV